jgi:FixJ family two-component response regulator
MTDAIFVLDDDADIRDTMCAVIENLLAVPCVTASSVAEMAREPGRVLQCRVAILDINLGPDEPSGLDAYRWLCDQDYRGAILFLTGHAKTHPLVDAANRLGHARVLEKPVGLGALRQAIGVAFP